MEELIKSLEAATEGSRELDRAIDLYLNPDTEIWSPDWYSGGKNEYLRWPDPSPGVAKYRHVYHYTTSLDAAMALIVKGWHWKIDSDGDVELYRGDPINPSCRWEFGSSKSPVIALCIAFLKARQT